MFHSFCVLLNPFLRCLRDASDSVLSTASGRLQYPHCLPSTFPLPAGLSALSCFSSYILDHLFFPSFVGSSFSFSFLSLNINISQGSIFLFFSQQKSSLNLLLHSWLKVCPSWPKHLLAIISSHPALLQYPIYNSMLVVCTGSTSGISYSALYKTELYSVPLIISFSPSLFDILELSLMISSLLPNTLSAPGAAHPHPQRLLNLDLPHPHHQPPQVTNNLNNWQGFLGSVLSLITPFHIQACSTSLLLD